MRSFAFLALPVAMGFLAVGCQSEDKASGDGAQEQSSPGDTVIAKLDTIVIPVVNFENASAEEAIDFLRQRSIELDPDRESSQRGISFIVRQARPIEASTSDGSSDLNPHSVALDYPVSYVGKDVPILDVLTEVARQGRLDAYLTSVGVIVTPEGKPPFPNPKATEGEVWKVLRKTK
jgi:hypothetical protein